MSSVLAFSTTVEGEFSVLLIVGVQDIWKAPRSERRILNKIKQQLVFNGEAFRKTF
jgi:hypothetical protein